MMKLIGTRNTSALNLQLTLQMICKLLEEITMQKVGVFVGSKTVWSIFNFLSECVLISASIVQLVERGGGELVVLPGATNGSTEELRGDLTVRAHTQVWTKGRK